MFLVCFILKEKGINKDLRKIIIESSFPDYFEDQAVKKDYLDKIREKPKKRHFYLAAEHGSEKCFNFLKKKFKTIKPFYIAAQKGFLNLLETENFNTVEIILYGAASTNQTKILKYFEYYLRFLALPVIAETIKFHSFKAFKYIYLRFKEFLCEEFILTKVIKNNCVRILSFLIKAERLNIFYVLDFPKDFAQLKTVLLVCLANNIRVPSKCLMKNIVLLGILKIKQNIFCDQKITNLTIFYFVWAVNIFDSHNYTHKEFKEFYDFFKQKNKYLPLIAIYFGNLYNLRESLKYNFLTKKNLYELYLRAQKINNKKAQKYLKMKILHFKN